MIITNMTRMAIESDDGGTQKRWHNVALENYTRCADMEPAAGRLYHHMAILAPSNYVLQFFNYYKSLTVGGVFFEARESFYRVTCHFVPPKNVTSWELSQPLSQDKDDFFTALSHLYLGSMDVKLEKQGNDTSREEHLEAFDKLIVTIKGGHAESLSMTRRAAGALVGPASVYAEPACVFRSKSTDEFTRPTRFSKAIEVKESVDKTSFIDCQKTVGVVQDYTLHPRYVPAISSVTFC